MLAYAIGLTVTHDRRDWTVVGCDQTGVHLVCDGYRLTLGWGEVFQ